MSADLEQKARQLISARPGVFTNILMADFARSVVSDIVGRLEERMKELDAKRNWHPDGLIVEGEILALERQVAELKKEYLEK